MIYIIPCGVQKQDHACVAGKMYTSGYHRTMLRYARSMVPLSHIYILSAKYGLLCLNEIIAPYSLLMGEQGSITTAQVRQQAATLGILDEEVVTFVGPKYRPICRTIWPTCTMPLLALDHLPGHSGSGRHCRYLNRYRGQPLPRSPKDLS